MLKLSAGKKPNQLIVECPAYWGADNSFMDKRRLVRTRAQALKYAGPEAAVLYEQYSALADLTNYLKSEHPDALDWLRANKCLRVDPTFFPRIRDKHGLPVIVDGSVVIAFRNKGLATLWATTFKGFKGANEP